MASLLKSQNLGLLNAVASILASSGPSRTPTSFGQVAGQGLMGYMQGKKYEDEMKRQKEQDELERKYKESLIANNKLGVTGRIGSYNPGDFTSESFSIFKETGDDSVLERYEPYATIDLGGGLKGLYNKATKEIFQPNTKQEFLSNVKDAASIEASGKVTGAGQAEAALNLPLVEFNAENITRRVDELLADPGFKGIIGLKDYTGILPGTPEQGALGRLKQIQGAAFLQAYQSLKGGGQITEIEGQKAEEALARLNRAQSEESFREAAEDFNREIRGLVEIARRRAGVPKDKSDKEAYELEYGKTEGAPKFDMPNIEFIGWK